MSKPTKENKNTIRENVLSKIGAGSVSMRPRWHFAVQTTLVLSGIAIAVLAILYCLSFVLFIFRQNGVLLAPAFGFRGVASFLFSTPWLIVALSIIFMGALEVLVRQFSFSYQKPLLYSIVGVLLFSLLGSFTIAQTSFHGKAGEFVQARDVPGLRSLYKDSNPEQRGLIHHGIIEEVTPDGFRLLKGVKSLDVVVDIRTRSSPQFKAVVGKSVIVLGEIEAGKLRAQGINPRPKNLRNVRGAGDREGSVKGVQKENTKIQDASINRGFSGQNRQ